MKQTTLLALLVVFAFGGCASDETTASSGGEGTMQVKMVDAPASQYDSIVVTVTEVSVHGSGSAGGWTTVSSTARSYNLLSLVNGAEAVMGEVKLSAGLYSQLRMTLSDSCRVYAGGVMLSLKVPSNQIIVNIHAEIAANVTTTLVLDFDAGRSLVMTGTGLIMKPVIRALTTSSAGYIQGSVNIRSSVTAYGNGDTLGTVTGSNNSFKIMYARPGTYSLTIVSGSALFHDSTLTNISVVSGQTTNVGMINLRAKL